MIADEIAPAIRWYVDEGFGDPFSLPVHADQPLVINAAITGMVPGKNDTPHVPVTPGEIIEDAERCFRAGATVLHLHARDEDGKPTYRTDVYEHIIPVIRRRCPGVVICTTTSGRVFNTFECRSEVLYMNGATKPDMASLTLGSINTPTQASVTSPDMITGLASLMREKGIMPELEVFEPGMINYGAYLLRKSILLRPCWFNLLFGSLGTMPAGIRDLIFLVESVPEGCQWAAAGIGRFQLPVNTAAVIMGGHVRVGLEDNIYFDCHKKELATNERLVERLAALARELGRGVATPEQTRSIIGLERWRRRAGDESDTET
jgi:uncharacterized protein (DUF849 family)